MNGESPLVDTSVLIDYFTGVRCRETALLDDLLEHGPPPATAAIIVQEYLQGLIEPTQFALAEADLRLFDRLPPPDYSLHLVAAENHVQMRRSGITIPTIDTLIVTMAQAGGVPLITRDRRQRDLARALKVRLWE
jgi:predicted nucleic acid-binding protein